MDATRRIPKGKVSTYADIARAGNHAPCHRIIGSDGCIGRYSGMGSKETHLKSEGIDVANGKIELKIFRAAI